MTDERVRQLRNLRSAYGLASAVGYWESLEGEDLIEQYAGLLAASTKLVSSYSDALNLYHKIHAAHHGENGPSGCPCCAEFSPQVAGAVEAIGVAISDWERRSVLQREEAA